MSVRAERKNDEHAPPPHPATAFSSKERDSNSKTGEMAKRQPRR